MITLAGFCNVCRQVDIVHILYRISTGEVVLKTVSASSAMHSEKFRPGSNNDEATNSKHRPGTFLTRRNFLKTSGLASAALVGSVSPVAAIQTVNWLRYLAGPCC